MLRRLPLILVFCFSVLWGQGVTPLEDLWHDWTSLQGRQVHAVLDLEISRICQERAEVLMSLGQLAHRDSRGRGPGEQMERMNGGTGEWGEILGAGPSLAEIFQAWIKSPSHREILADPRWQEWGWGRAARGPTQVYVVRFWRP